jgi:hypothetical protein
MGRKGRSLERRKGKMLGNIPLLPSVSFFDNRFNRAYLETTPTFRTFLFVDGIGFPLLDGFGGAFFRTSPAGHTFFGNDISHRYHPLSS